ncbi:MAG: DUF3040 domain-containing protein [Nocardioides sp.]
MPLSEEELRLLEQMERALVAEDPKLASTLRGTSLRASARRRSILAGGVFVVGIAVLMAGAVLQQTWLGIAGFVVMLGSAYVALSSWRNQHQGTEPGAHPTAAGTPSLSVLEGGRARSRRNRQRGAGRSHGSMMQRFEERWRRRRDEQGY